MKKNILFLLQFLCLLCVAFTWEEQAAVSEFRENYRYEAIPEGKGGQKEDVIIEITRNEENLLFRMHTDSTAGLEEIQMEMYPSGYLVSASRRFSSKRENATSLEEIRRERGKAYLQKGIGPEEEVRSFVIPSNKSFAVDGSLLILIRGYPFDRDEAWPIYMVDFSGAGVNVTLRKKGSESVTVPAGTFDCYKMEVTVEVPIFRPRIIYWVAKEEPHFLVKSIGKRGPFTPSFETSLLSKN